MKYRFSREGLQLQAKEATIGSCCGKNSMQALYNCTTAKMKLVTEFNPTHTHKVNALG